VSKRPIVPSGQPDQLSFAFPAGPLRFDQLVITPASQAAVSIVRQPAKWPMPVLCVTGPPRCGLTTLLRAWCEEVGGTYFTATAFSRLKPAELNALAGQFVAVDDADKVAANETLLTFINRTGEEGGKLLLASSNSPSQWPVSSADLKSRLNSMPIAEILQPDEPMLYGRLNAAAARRFLKLEPEILSYLSLRLDLTYEAIEAFAEKLSDGVTTTGRAPSVPLAKEVLEALGLSEPDEPWTN
jgi:chromosomal replication initiation ATPase DnaA